MPYYLVGRGSTQKVGLLHGQCIAARSPMAAVRIAERLLTLARKHSPEGADWDCWFVALINRRSGDWLPIARGGVQ